MRKGRRSIMLKGLKSERDIDWFQHTYYLDSVSRCGCDVPGTLLTAGILVWPVRAAQGPTGAVDLMLTLSWTHTHAYPHTRERTHASTHIERKLKSWLHRKRSEEMEREQEGKKWENQKWEKRFQSNTSGWQVQCKFHTSACMRHMVTVTVVCIDV